MSVESAADRLAMLDAWDSAVFGGASISGVLNDAFTEALGVEGSNPVFTCRVDASDNLLDDAGTSHAVAHGDSITVNGNAYTVNVVKPDGQGMADIVLQKV